MEGRHKYILLIPAANMQQKTPLGIQRSVKGDMSRVTTLLRPLLAEKGLTGCHHTPAL
jgi:hypothetical protein